MASLRKLRGLRDVNRRALWLYNTRVWGMDIHPSVEFSRSAQFDRTNPRGVHIGAETYVTLRVIVLAHDYTKGAHVDTWIGRQCFIGARSVIMPGIRVGDGSIVGAGSVVVKDVPPRSIVAGNPARVIRTDIETGPYGRLIETIPERELDNFWTEVKKRRERLAAQHPGLTF